VSDEKIIEDALTDFARQFASDNPKVAAIIEEARSGKLEEHVALHKLMEAVMSDPELQTALVQQAMITLPQAGEKLAEEMPGIYQPPSGLPRWDPAWEAQLYERIQFDEDAPELRHEALPPGVRPAVPVKNAGPNPVALGFSLHQASEEVLEEIRLLTSKIEESDETGLITTNPQTAIATQPEGFRPGQLPTLRETSPPTGAQLIAIPKEEQRKLAWDSFTKTQGRRSAAPTLANMISRNLKLNGIDHVDVGTHSGTMTSSKEGIISKATWVVNITGSGPLSTNEGFSLMENAAAALANELATSIDTEEALSIEVCTIDSYSTRLVGWAALLRK